MMLSNFGTHAIHVCSVVLNFCFCFASYCSLAVHPNKVLIASGQTAGVDKDGKVNLKRRR